MSEHGSSDGNEIYDIVIECSNLFETIILFENGDHSGNQPADASHLQPGKNDTTRRTRIGQLGRSFDLWINYTGALASIDRSLDNRLRDHSDIKEMVMDLLEMLHRNLCYISSGNISKERQELDEEAWKATEKSVTDLHFMAAAIRRASTQSQKYVLSSTFEQNEEAYFEDYATILARRDFPNARRSLCEHLGASVAVRRQKIFRKKAHEEKLSKRREKRTTKYGSPQLYKAWPKPLYYQQWIIYSIQRTGKVM
ncbi:hypothetical protein TrVGV298_006080 [Trichoderma virens]|nr:hypothetical protein TrVGV298_006080 [Trichoderma virens]